MPFSTENHPTLTVTHYLGKPLTYVFGSNLRGTHGTGAALHARRWFNAKNSEGHGFTGQAYALPTKQTPAATDTLPLTTVLDNIERFKADAAGRPNDYFQVTRVGCGFGGLGEFEEQIRDAFLDAPANCLLPGIWESYRQPGLTRLIVAGSREVTDYNGLAHWLDRLLEARSPELVMILNGMAPGVDRMGGRYATQRGYSQTHMRALWDLQKKQAGHLRNMQMGWYGTHLAAAWDGVSDGTKDMIDIADREGLTRRMRIFPVANPKPLPQPSLFPS